MDRVAEDREGEMKKKTKILVVDDEPIVRVSLANWLKEDGYEVGTAESGAEALRMAAEDGWEILFVDVKMPKMNGLEVLKRVKENQPAIPVVMITAYASVESAVTAMKEGAYDYIVKPFEPDEIRMLVKRILKNREIEEENVALKQRLDERFDGDVIVGDSPSMRQVFALVRDVADADSTVLIAGESGTGKELIARAIHANSPRRYMPFVPASLGALPDTLVESELFGHEKGAFTGAQFARKGRFEMADGGTLFLDEVGEISPKTQVDLLRVLQDRMVVKIGGGKPVEVDVRVVAATNRDLQEAVRQGTFREDLFYRLNVVNIHLPPLRDRREDILPLADHFLHIFASKTSKKVKGFSEEARNLLFTYDWPGNVRELENAIERAFVVVKGDEIETRHLPFSIQSTPSEGGGRALRDMEKVHIKRVLDEMDWNITQAASALEVDRATLYNKIKKYDLKKDGS